MADFAVIKTGGKQYKVKEGDILEIEKIADTTGKIEFTDLFAGKKVTASFIEEFRDSKIRVYKFKRKTRYKKVQGHRQTLNRIKIESIA